MEEDLTSQESPAHTSKIPNAQQNTITDQSKSLPEIAEPEEPSSVRYRSKNAGILTPAVRHMIKENGINVEEINGTRKDG